MKLLDNGERQSAGVINRLVGLVRSRLSGSVKPQKNEKEPPKSVPQMDLVDTGDVFYVAIMLPGVEPDQLTLEKFPRQLKVSAPGMRHFPMDTGRWLAAECPVTGYERRINFAEAVNWEAALMTFRDGVLRLCVPRASFIEDNPEAVTQLLKV